MLVGLLRPSGVRWMVGRSVDQRRLAMGLGIGLLAASVGCSRTTIHAMLRGKVGVGLRKLAAIAWALECEAAALIDEANDVAHVAPPPTCGAPMDLVRVFARNVNAWRRRRGLVNLESLARAAAMSTTQLYAIVGARCDPSIDRVEDLGLALEVPPHRLLRAVDGGFSVS